MAPWNGPNNNYYSNSTLIFKVLSVSSSVNLMNVGWQSTLETKPTNLDCESADKGCYHPHPHSPFSIIVIKKTTSTKLQIIKK